MLARSRCSLHDPLARVDYAQSAASQHCQSTMPSLAHNILGMLGMLGMLLFNHAKGAKGAIHAKGAKNAIYI